MRAGEGASSLRIVVTGLAATYPFGGVFWDYLQYAIGLERLGHRTLYLEDTGGWCYSPAAGTFVPDGRANAAALGRALARAAPGLRWSYRDARGRTYGERPEDVARFCDGADLLLNVSAACLLRDAYRRAERLALVDSDPMYTQALLHRAAAPAARRAAAGGAGDRLDEGERHRVETLLSHDAFFTFAENIGAPDCRVPAATLDWIPTRQPVVLDLFAPARVPVRSRRRVATTVASWEPAQDGPLVDGVRYRGKSAEFERFLDLPSRSPLPLELALNGRAPFAELRARGWRLADPDEAAGDPWRYREHLARSLAEWSVAKNAYVASRSGWFSGRSALYLALGVPVIVQDTGFGRALPTGRGVLPFATPDDAVRALHEVADDPGGHAVAAREAAEAAFDSDAVLARLLEAALAA